MPSAKSGSAATLVSPAAPREAKEADVADPGEVEKAKAQQQQSGTGKYGQTPIGPPEPSGPAGQAGPTQPTHWISFELKDKKTGAPCADERYEVTLPDGSTREGTLDEHGRAKITDMPAGQCQIDFPDIDGREWQAG